MTAHRGKYADELIANAAILGTPEKGILAIDNFAEFDPGFISLTLFGYYHYLSGVISNESLYMSNSPGESLVNLFKRNGVLTGITLDEGTIELAGTNGETTTKGLDGLAQRCQKYYAAGARFAKWRAVLKIGAYEPSQLAIQYNANGLALYAIICQENGLVPIIEPEILVDGFHDIIKCAEVTERVLAACYKSLNDYHVLLEGTLLKPNMVTPGSDAPKVTPEVVAEYTVCALQRTIPPAVPAVFFFSGGQNEKQATRTLDAMNKLKAKKPWTLSFFLYGRKTENNLISWDLVLRRLRDNSEATLGGSPGDSAVSASKSEVLLKASTSRTTSNELIANAASDQGDKASTSRTTRFADELAANAAIIGTPGKGIIAVDDYVESVDHDPCFLILYCATRGLQYLSGVIFSHASFCGSEIKGKHFVDVFNDAGVLAGIRLDRGTIRLAGTNGETTTKGLDDLAERCPKYYAAGGRFAEWRAVLKIGANEPSQLAIQDSANGLAIYAIICQENGLVPIIEPEILVDGFHDINKCAEVTERVLAACYKALNDYHVLLEGTLLRINMVTPGSYASKVTPEVVAEYTVRALQRTIPPAVPAVVFLSGEQSKEEATCTLKAMNKLKAKKPWTLSLSFGRALHQGIHEVFADSRNPILARDAFLTMMKANSEALGTDQGDNA
ncbi:fructose-bisphosphate aldolase 6, cytosolic-like isoform X2 [Salvia splendens]|uniref:fructose-bisphosphate aldolase 6, cytosolic-like isoform X2 n=1 Tax=Salvia splendens TaxID=180675 RepID=UPI001C270CB8|nr:fructose-bisphosphate aldolase 6, cytosolic-like isoform X2 [Salvia splendens]